MEEQLGPSAQRLAQLAREHAKHDSFLGNSHTINSTVAPPTEDAQRTRVNFLLLKSKTKAPKRANRIHATRKELLDLKFVGDVQTDEQLEEERKRKRALFPQPDRSCSRQTGAIVYRHYDDGRNPFQPIDEVAVGRAARKGNLTYADIQEGLQYATGSTSARRGRRQSEAPPGTGSVPGSVGVASTPVATARPSGNREPRRPSAAAGAATARAGRPVPHPPSPRRSPGRSRSPGAAKASQREAPKDVSAMAEEAEELLREIRALPDAIPDDGAEVDYDYDPVVPVTAPTAGGGSPARGGDADDPAAQTLPPRAVGVGPPPATKTQDGAFGAVLSEVHDGASDDDGAPVSPLTKPKATVVAADGEGSKSPPMPASPLLRAIAVSTTGRALIRKSPSAAFGPRGSPSPSRASSQTHMHTHLASVVARQPTVYRIAQRTAKEARDAADPTLQLKPSKVLERERLERRRQILQKHQALLRHHNVVESTKVEQLVRAVMSLNALGDGSGSSGGMAGASGSGNGGKDASGEKKKRHKAKHYMQGTGHFRGQPGHRGRDAADDDADNPLKAITNDERYDFSLDHIKSLHSEFERLTLEHAFLGALSTGQPVLFGGHLVTPEQLRKCSDVNLDIAFEPLVRLVRSDVPDFHLNTTFDHWHTYREELKNAKVSFRERLDLATVLDIDRVWGTILETYASKGDEMLVTCDPPHERGITLAEYTRYLTHMNNVLSAADAQALFAANAVPGGYAKLLPSHAATKFRAAEAKAEVVRRLQNTNKQAEASKAAAAQANDRSVKFPPIKGAQASVHGTPAGPSPKDGPKTSRSIAFTMDDDDALGVRVPSPDAEATPLAAQSPNSRGSFTLQRTASVASKPGSDETPPGGVLPPSALTSKASSPQEGRKRSADKRSAGANAATTAGDDEKKDGGLQRTRSLTMRKQSLRRVRSKKQLTSFERSLQRAKQQHEALSNPDTLAEVALVMTIEGFANTVAGGPSPRDPHAASRSAR